MGYRYNDGMSSKYNCQSTTLFDADRMHSIQNNTDCYDGDHLSDEDEEVKETQGEYESPTSLNGKRLNRDHLRSSKRSHVPWLVSDEQRLLSYKDKINIEWQDIVGRFKGRTAAAVKLRYYILRRRP